MVEGRYSDLTPEEGEKDRFIRAVINGTRKAGQYESMEALVGTRAAVEITCFTGHLLKTMRLMQAFGVPDTSREHVTGWGQAIVDGRVGIPDSRARVPSPVAAAAAVSN